MRSMYFFFRARNYRVSGFPKHPSLMGETQIWSRVSEGNPAFLSLSNIGVSYTIAKLFVSTFPVVYCFYGQSIFFEQSIFFLRVVYFFSEEIKLRGLFGVFDRQMLDSRFWLYQTQDRNHFLQYLGALIREHIPICIFAIGCLYVQLQANKLQFCPLRLVTRS